MAFILKQTTTNQRAVLVIKLVLFCHSCGELALAITVSLVCRVVIVFLNLFILFAHTVVLLLSLSALYSQHVVNPGGRIPPPFSPH